MSGVNLDTFPSTKSEALTMLYLQNQNLSEMSPEDIVNLYSKTLNEIRVAFKNSSKSKMSFFGQ